MFLIILAYIYSGLLPPPLTQQAADREYDGADVHSDAQRKDGVKG